MLTIGSAIRARREALDLTQQALAARIGHQKPTRISRWETGAEGISRQNVARVAEALACTVADLDPRAEAYHRTGARRTRRQREAVEGAVASGEAARDLEVRPVPRSSAERTAMSMVQEIADKYGVPGLEHAQDVLLHVLRHGLPKVGRHSGGGAQTTHQRG